MSDPVSRPRGFSTRAIHHAYDPYAGPGALNPPVYLSATYTFPTVEDGAARFAGEQAGYVYSRVGNPTTDLLEQRIASLEGGEAALVTASGMGAITSLLWTLLQPGDEIIADKTLYGCTFGFLNHGLARFGVRVTHVDMTDPAQLAQAIGPRTRVVYFETPANPNMRLVDIAAIAAVARRHDARVVADNTYCTPYLQRPLELGADFVVHSATKYLGGHGDLVAGAVVGPKAALDEVRFAGLKDMTGAVMSAQDAFLVLRGLKTLALRMHRHSENAQGIAERLAAHDKVAVVHYPGLADCPQRDLARRQMKLPGGMLAFELRGGIEAGRRFMNALGLVTRAVSLGDAETLAQHPASMTHSFYTPEERRAHMISEGLVRLSAGLEDLDDLLDDVDQALAAA
ncbi:methionine gamma-lyase [Nitrogeniibacter mangrovi]|uniref:L-methionine gamma-lyase n=1 Tax=Nitrogeniibacter mangrovi TaxID=2016596 RepID=A0A6C1B6J6_9RHOO|nr:methionine gamma-lyase [Nitrogeniibacter mangrovi]QID19321.1 methionine gamma-lyase [Nitrogeniibacter mangrovi]